MAKPKRRAGESESAFNERLEAYLERDRKRSAERLADPSYREVQQRRVRDAMRRKREADPELGRSEARERMKARRADPESYEVDKGRNRDWRTRQRALPEDHPGTCDVCGIRPTARSNGHRGISQDHRHDNNVIRGYLCHSCNIKVAVLDLAFTDPELFAALKAYSLRGAPVVPVASEHPTRRRKAVPHPTLFDE